MWLAEKHPLAYAETRKYFQTFHPDKRWIHCGSDRKFVALTQLAIAVEQIMEVTNPLGRIGGWLGNKIVMESKAKILAIFHRCEAITGR